MIIGLYFLIVISSFSIERTDLDKYKQMFIEVHNLYYKSKFGNEETILKELKKSKSVEMLILYYWEKLKNEPNNAIVKKKIIKNIEKLDNKSIKNPMTFYIKGYFLFKENKYNDSELNYRKSIELGIIDVWNEIYPNLIYSLYFDFANSFSKNNNFFEAEKYYKKLISVTQKDCASYLILADFYFRKLNEIDLGLDYIEIALELANNGYTKDEMIARIYNMQGKMYEAKREISKATYCYKHAIEKDEKNKKYKNNLKKIMGEKN